VTKDVLINPYFKIVVFFFLYYLLGLLSYFGLGSFQKESWVYQLKSFFQAVLPHLLQVLLISLLAGLLFIWIPTMLGMLPVSIVSKSFSFLSTFSFSVFVSTIQGWLFIKGFSVIKKHQTPLENGKTRKLPSPKLIQPIIFFLGLMLLLSILLDFFLSFFAFYLTTEYLFVKLVKLSCTLKI